MMAGCPGCFLSGRELQAQYESIKLKAIEFSKTHEVAVAIYKEIDGYYFINAETARENNYPIQEIIKDLGENG